MMQSCIYHRHNCRTLSQLVRQIVFQRYFNNSCHGKKSVSHCFQHNPHKRPFTFAYLSHYWPEEWKHGRCYGTSLFKSDALEQTCPVDLDLDLDSQLSDVSKLEQLLKQRGIKMDVKTLVSDYRELMRLRQQTLQLESERKRIAFEIRQLTKEEKDKSEDFLAKKQSLMNKGKEVKTRYKPLMRDLWSVEERLIPAALELPNSLLTKTPLEGAEILEEHFSDKKRRRTLSHMEMVEKTKMVKFSNVGIRACYLTGRLAELEQELIQYFTKAIRCRGYTQMLCPEIVKTPIVEGYGFNIEDSSEVYKLEKDEQVKSDDLADNLFLRGASQLSLLAYLMRMVWRESDLPLKLFCVGRSYIPETSSLDTLPGLFGVLQSVKMEGCAVCKDTTQAEGMSQKFREDLIQIYSSLRLPLRLVSLPAFSLLRCEQYKEELQMWVPSLQDYIKVGAVWVTGDFCSRRLMMRWKESAEKKVTYPVHMVHTELVDVMRLIALLIEHDQTEHPFI